MSTVTNLISFVLAVGTFGCTPDARPPSTTELIGTYIGRYGEGLEKLTVKADGSFDQIFQRGSNVVYTASGKWSLKESRVHFEPFISPDGMRSGSRDGQPDSRPSKLGIWHRDPIRIEFGNWPYEAVKVKGEGATIKSYKQE